MYNLIEKNFLMKNFCNIFTHCFVTTSLQVPRYYSDVGKPRNSCVYSERFRCPPESVALGDLAECRYSDEAGDCEWQVLVESLVSACGVSDHVISIVFKTCTFIRLNDNGNKLKIALCNRLLFFLKLFKNT